MSRLVFFSVIVFCATSLYAQEKESVKKHKIKSITVTDTDFENSKGKTVKESFTRFDESGNIVELIEYDKEGKENLHETYEFDVNGNKIREIQYLPNNVKDKIIEYKYETGIRTERITYYANGKVKSKKTYQYEYHK